MENNASYESRGRPVVPIVSRQPVSVYRGRVYMAPRGFTAMGPDAEGRMIATNGEGTIAMVEIGLVDEYTVDE